MKKKLCRRLVSISLAALIMMGSIPASSIMVQASEAGWKQNETGWWYQNPDNSYKKSEWLLDTDKNWYHFNEAGYMETGWVWDKSEWYYLNHIPNGTRGAMQTGWIWDEANWYFADITGRMQTGWICDGTNWYFTDADGKMQTGVISVNDKVYYLNPVSDGERGKMLTGDVSINGTVYHFDENGAAFGNKPEAERNYKADGFQIILQEHVQVETDSDYDNDYDNSDYDDDYDDSDDDDDSSSDNDNTDDKEDTDDGNTEGIISFTNSQLESNVRHYLNKTSGTITAEDVKEFVSLTISFIGYGAFIDYGANEDVFDGTGKIILALNDSKYEYLWDVYLIDDLDNIFTDLCHFPNLKKIEMKEVYDYEADNWINGGYYSTFEDAEQILTVLADKYTAVENLSIEFNVEASDNELDLACLSGFSNLKELSITDGNISDIASLRNLSSLEKLDIRNNKLFDIDVLAGLINLKEVLVEGNPYISDYSALKNVETRDVTLNDDGYILISDILSSDNITMDIFRQYTGKSDTNIYANDVVAVSGFEITEMRYNDSSFYATLKAIITDTDGNTMEISAEGNTEHSYDGFVFCQNLTSFNTSKHNFDEDIAAFSYLRDLIYLDLGQTFVQGNICNTDRQIQDFRPLLNMSQLEYLNLDHSVFLNEEDVYAKRNVKNLSNLQNLDTLILSWAQFGRAEYDCFDEFPVLRNLRTLDLSYSNITDLQPLAGLKNLETLNLKDVEVEDYSPVEHVENVIK